MSMNDNWYTIFLKNRSINLQCSLFTVTSSAIFLSFLIHSLNLYIASSIKNILFGNISASIGLLGTRCINLYSISRAFLIASIVSRLKTIL